MFGAVTKLSNTVITLRVTVIFFPPANEQKNVLRSGYNMMVMTNLVTYTYVAILDGKLISNK